MIRSGVGNHLIAGLFRVACAAGRNLHIVFSRFKRFINQWRSHNSHSRFCGKAGMYGKMLLHYLDDNVAFQWNAAFKTVLMQTETWGDKNTLKPIRSNAAENPKCTQTKNPKPKKSAFKMRFFYVQKIIFRQMHVQSRSRLIRPYAEILSGHAGQAAQQHHQGMPVSRITLHGQFPD